MDASDWDFGPAKPTITLALPRSLSGDPTESVEELFWVTNYKLGTVIRAIRPRDHIDLSFFLRGLRCVDYASIDGQPRLVRIQGVQRCLVRVHFPSQHIAEQIKSKPLDGACKSAATWGAMRIRLSQPSRLVFAVPDRVNWAPRLRLAELTDWSRLTPIVNRRANVGAELAAQLAIAFPAYKPVDWATLDFSTAQSLIAAGLEAPSEGETAIEIPGRLILSPSKAGRWIVPGDLPGKSSVPLWTARLDRSGRTSVRAIWSTRLEPRRIPDVLEEPTAPGGSMLSLSRRNHWEIVAQTSVYGMAALRRLALEQPALDDVDAVAAPPPTVVRPDLIVGFLEAIDLKHSYANQDSGIALATPFDDADISASALGGLADISWHGDPPSLFLTVDHEPTSLSLERLSYRGFLGRDTEVVAVEKGYLFPLGIRASLVTVHERTIYPNAVGEPVSYLVCRRFIATPRRSRSYPGPYQPFDGRDFPARRVLLKTQATPDLAPIANIPLRLPKESEPLPNESVFWPQAEAGGAVSDLLFEWSTEDAASVRSKLIFVHVGVIGRPDVMRVLVDYYNDEADDRRTAWLGGARHRYALPQREGDTSFDTTSWRLSAQGRRDGVNGVEHFARDGRMEGANQPPFYPLMDRAFISVQSIEQMLGVPHGQVEVRYFDEYKREGFDTKHQIYLTLGASALSLRASTRSERSGGIASPDLNVAALSRLTGLVGGSMQNRRAGDLPDFSSAVAGTFNPKQFFGEAKLLGVVSLADIVEVATAAFSLDLAPQLIDETLFGAREIESMQEVARTLRDTLYGADRRSGLVKRLEEGINRADAVLAGASLSLKQVYPSLTDAMEPLLGTRAEVLTLLDALISARTAEEARPPIATLVPKVRTLLDAAVDVIKDPVPDAFEHIIERVQKIFEALLNGADLQVRDLAAAAVELFQKWLDEAFCTAVDAEGFGTVLFGERGTLSCTEIFADPPGALRAFAGGLYGAVLDQVLEGMASVFTLENDLRARLDLELDWMRDTTSSALHSGVALIADRLLPFDPTLEDVQDAQRQARFVTTVLADLRPLLTPPSGIETPQQALKFAKAVVADLPDDARHAINARLAELLPAIHSISNVDKQKLLDELSMLVRQHLEERLVVPLTDMASSLASRLTKQVENSARSGFVRLMPIASVLFDAVLKNNEIAAIARAGRAVQDVCDMVSEAAKLIADGAMAPVADIEAGAHAIVAAVVRIQPPVDTLNFALRSALASLSAAAGQVLDTCKLLDVERRKLKQVAGTICAATRDFLDPVAALFRLRRNVAHNLVEIARQCEAVNSIFATGRPSSDERAALAEVIERCAQLCLGVTGITVLRTQQPVLAKAIMSIEAAGLGANEYRQRLHAAADEVTTRAEALYADLSRAIDPEQLHQLLDSEVRQFQDSLDRKLAGFLLQCIGFTPTTLAAIEVALAKALKTFVGKLLPIYVAVEKVLDMILDHPLMDPVLEKVYKLALGGDLKIQALRDARDSLKRERQDVVEAIANEQNPNLADVVALVARYRNGNGALPKVIAAVEALGITDVGQTLTEALREELKQIEDAVRTLVLQLVPTKVQTRYFWTTQLQRFPDSEDGWVFQPSDSSSPSTRPSEPPTGHPVLQPGFVWHLWIDGRFSFDVVTGKREVEILGVLRPFELRLLGDKFWMLTISFEETRFTSVNGATPDFAVKVKDVTIGTYLKFVEKLQQWLAPQGSGFYLQPTEGFPGIEVGYLYDAGIIQIGSLQFINVAFRIAAKLPFSADGKAKGKAQFVFALASRDRPFLISCPPYGGGGWVSITCTSDSVEELDLAFVFGGVAAIKFGPLNAQGRIVAGVRVQSLKTDDDKEAHVITAIFEAVGEGNIACFSISVSIRITLTQKTGGALLGETTYRFSFKVGFVRLTYSVSARYRLSNGSDPKAVSGLTVQVPSGAAIIRTVVPIKETEWQTYRRLFDLELLEAA